jgi:gliding motility-associated-like protein
MVPVVQMNLLRISLLFPILCFHAHFTFAQERAVIFRKEFTIPQSQGTFFLAKSGQKTWMMGIRYPTSHHLFLAGFDSCYDIAQEREFYLKNGAPIFLLRALTGWDNGSIVGAFSMDASVSGPFSGGLLKINRNGELEWGNVYCEYITQLKIHPNGSVYFLGKARVRDTLFSCLGQVAANGGLVNARIFKNIEVQDLDVPPDGSVLLSAHPNYLDPDSSGRDSVFDILKLDASLKIISNQRFQVLNNRGIVMDIIRTSDNGIIIAISLVPSASGTTPVGLVKIDTLGRPAWTKVLPDHFYHLSGIEANESRTHIYLGLRDCISALGEDGTHIYSRAYFSGPDNHRELMPDGENGLLFYGYDGFAKKMVLVKTENGLAACGGVNKKLLFDSLTIVPQKTATIQTEQYFSEYPVDIAEMPVNNLIDLKTTCEKFTHPRSFPEDTTLCFGSTLRLDAGHAGANHLWSTGDTSQVIEITEGGLYWVHNLKDCYDRQDTINVRFIEKTFVELGADRRICPGDSTQFEAVGTVPGLTYQWNLPKKDANGQPIAVKGNTLWAKDSGMYTVRVADAGGCLDLDTVYIYSHPLPRPDAGPDTTICYGSIIQMHGKGGITYLWTPADYLDDARIASPKAGPPKTQKYVLTISDTNGCSAHDTVWLNVKPPLHLQFDKKTASSCQGNLVTFTATASGGQPGQHKIEWQKQGTTNWIAGNKSSWKADSSYTIIVRVNDGCSKEFRDSVYIIAIDTPKPQISIIPISGCEPLLVIGKVTGDTTGVNFRWDMGDGIKYTTAEPVHWYAKKGKYKVIVRVINKVSGCRSEPAFSKEIEVLERPEAIMDINPKSTDLFHPEITFSSRSKNAATISWEMNGVRLSDKVVYTHIFTDTGAHVMKLIAYHKNGCTDTASGKVYVREPFVVHVPNVFTPNRDGINEPFRPVVMGITEAPMQIYNRWGECVFNGDGLKGWDGSFNGRFCADGVYLYMLQVKGREGEREYYRGTVTLLK